MKKTVPAPETAPAPLTLEEIHQAMNAAEAASREHCKRRAAHVQELEQAERRLQSLQANVGYEERRIASYQQQQASYDAAVEEAAKVGRRLAPFQWTQQGFPLTEADIERIHAEIASLQQRIPALREAVHGFHSDTQDLAARTASFRSQVEPELEQRLLAAQTLLANLKEEAVRLREQMATEQDADRLVQMRACADELPLRLVVAEISAIRIELAHQRLAIQTAHDAEFFGQRRVALEDQLAQLEQAKANLLFGRPMRLAATAA